VSSPTRRSVSGTPAFESTPTRASIRAPGAGERSPSTTPGGTPVLDEDPVDHRVRDDAATVREERLGERIDLHLVPADPDAGRVVEGEGDAIRALPAPRNGAPCSQNATGVMSVCRHGSDSNVRSHSSGPVICDISSTSKPMAYAQISKMRSSLLGSGWGVNEHSSLNSTIVSCTRSWTASIRSPSCGECFEKFSAVRSGSWQMRQFVPSRNVVARITGLALKRKP